jgi:metal-responsive CopG/Arc/MetJ family transcriptional regulator
MRVKTSITLSEDTLRALDRAAGSAARSPLIEVAIKEFLERRYRVARDARDREILDRTAESLNDEITDALAFQEEP